ncbi:MAG: orotidine-5'-phosphate decarboxylase [Oscillospiraceae bacterium]|jgi:orotidine-5'-phosphate decarboxylase|nr:orotidine-5'-phosphate decarboxylase [Oscillospiraceae bacterium]
MINDVVVACDFSSESKTLNFLSKFKEKKPFVKIGLELFCGEGPNIIRKIKSGGNKIFLDLKLHDIPNTVKKTMMKISELNVDMVTVHAGGGAKMISAAKEGLSFKENSALLMVVTVLTSVSQKILNKELLFDRTLEEVAEKYAVIAQENGADGVICSCSEVPSIKNICKKSFLTVTPGIRYKAANDDQIRIFTPQEAKKFGSDFIVVGRPITASNDPVGEYKKILKDFLG